MSKEFWDKRFSSEEYMYGEAPNEYVREKLKELPAGSILFPGEGEGRNAVYAAELGWEVHCFDQSAEGKKKALVLADKRNVKIDYRVMEGEALDYQNDSFDAAALVYTHFPPDVRSEIHRNLAQKIKSGGWLILEVYSKGQMRIRESGEGTGGPGIADMLMSLEELKDDFDNFEFVEAIETITELKEGVSHTGKAAVVRLFGKKKF